MVASRDNAGEVSFGNIMLSWESDSILARYWNVKLKQEMNGMVTRWKSARSLRSSVELQSGEVFIGG